MVLSTLKSVGRVLLFGILLGVAPAWAQTQTEVAKLLAGDGAAGDQFGVSVAVAGDTAVIGSPGDDDHGENTGAVYVFTRSGAGVWTQQAKLLASDGAVRDLFGNAVAVAGDTAVIGAPGDDDKGATSGSAYVFSLGSQVVPPQILSFTATPTLGTTPIVGVPVAFAVTVADPTKVQSMQWDFDSNGTVDQTTTALTTQFTYTTARSFTATVTVIDTDGGKASAATTVTVQSPTQAIATAIALVQQLPVNSGQKNSLTSKLDDARDLISKGNITGACGKLSDVVSQLNAFVQSRQLSAADAAPLLGEVQAIQQSLECS